MLFRSVVAAGATVRLAGHVAGPSAAERTLWAKVAAWLDERGAQPFTVGEVSRELRMGEPATRSLLHRLRGAGEVWRMDDERFMLRRHVAGLAARAAALAREAGSDGFTAAQFRDAIGIGRGRAIQVLEFFDRVEIGRAHV